ncbi:hypothetical protein [Azospirillum sp. ST 5-10]|uniref:hypothetical protein n=1 Tax=unclassified Azospirillum TaxID=2630922 RepID=UPI003F49E311
MARSRRGPLRGGILLAAVLATAGCASPGAVEGTAAGPSTWLSYLSGEDLRAACRQDDSDRFRLIVNADYNQHVRAYDVVADAENGGAMLEARVVLAADIARIDLVAPLDTGQGEVARTRLTPRQFAAFVLGLYESGAFDPVPQDALLRSRGIHWMVQGCHAGTWFFNVHPYPADRFADVRFGPGGPAAVPPLPPTASPR